MKHSILTFALILCWMAGFAQQKERNISIIPEPVSLLKKGGYYVLPDKIIISSPSGSETAYVNGLLTEKLSLAPGKKVVVKPNATNGDIELSLNRTADKTIGDEGYTLSVTRQKLSSRPISRPDSFTGYRPCFSSCHPTLKADKEKRTFRGRCPLWRLRIIRG